MTKKTCAGCTMPRSVKHWESGYDSLDEPLCFECVRFHQTKKDYYTPKDHRHDYVVLDARGGFIDICWKCGKVRE